jgi:excisionase family DNA binding protein
MTERTVPTLPPEVFESVVNSLAEALVRDYRERWSRRGADPDRVSIASAVGPAPTWLRIPDAAKRAQCGEATIRREVRAGRLRAVKVGGRRSLRFRAEWVDEWLQGGARHK